MQKLFLTALLLAGSGALYGQSLVLDDSMSGPVTEPKAGVSMDLSGIDKTADPCVSFYDYACGNWRKNNPIPEDQTRWGQFNVLAERNTYLLYQEIKKASEHPKTPLQVKYGNFFAACMNTDALEQLGSKPIEADLTRIAEWKDKAALAAMLGASSAHRGGSSLFGFGSGQDQMDSTQQIAELFQGGTTLPDRDYYLQDDPRSKKIRDQYRDHVTKMFVLLGDEQARAEQEAAAVMEIETSLAKGQLPRVEMRNPHNVYHIMTRAELQALTPDFKWDAFFLALNEQQLKTLNVATPGYFKAMNEQIVSRPIEMWRSYFRWKVVHRAAGDLSKKFDEENFRFFSQTLAGQKVQTPRWKRCTRETDSALGEAVGQDWVKNYFPPEAKKNIKEMVTALETALGSDIQSLGWMSDATKVEAQKKLASFRDKIGYPDKWRDYSTLTINRSDYYGNENRVSVFRQRRSLSKIGKPVDEKEWGMTPPTVNAYYNPSQNDINFPAGILQPPFYDFKIDPAVNFGGIGVVIGHEMTHGFDDQGSQFDEKGNVRMWWTAEDRKKFEERTDCEVKEYGSFEPVPGAKLNGKLTLGENTADNGGLRVSYDALHSLLAKNPGAAEKTIDGYTVDQRYFLGFAQVWCENTREEQARLRAKTDPHSSGRFRVDGSVQNFEKFGEAFGCKKGQPMMPTNSCRVW